MLNTLVEMTLTLKTVDNILRSVTQNTLGINQPSLFAGFIHGERIADAAAKIAPFSYASNHLTSY
jgi:hypothetical protein